MKTYIFKVATIVVMLVGIVTACKKSDEPTTKKDLPEAKAISNLLINVCGLLPDEAISKVEAAGFSQYRVTNLYDDKMRIYSFCYANTKVDSCLIRLLTNNQLDSIVRLATYQLILNSDDGVSNTLTTDYFLQYSDVFATFKMEGWTGFIKNNDETHYQPSRDVLLSCLDTISTYQVIDEKARIYPNMINTIVAYNIVAAVAGEFQAVTDTGYSLSVYVEKSK